MRLSGVLRWIGIREQTLKKLGEELGEKQQRTHDLSFSLSPISPISIGNVISVKMQMGRAHFFWLHVSTICRGGNELGPTRDRLATATERAERAEIKGSS